MKIPESYFRTLKNNSGCLCPTGQKSGMETLHFRGRQEKKTVSFFKRPTKMVQELRIPSFLVSASPHFDSVLFTPVKTFALGVGEGQLRRKHQNLGQCSGRLGTPGRGELCETPSPGSTANLQLPHSTAAAGRARDGQQTHSRTCGGPGAPSGRRPSA